MSGPECWHPTDAEVTADTEWCTDCGEPLDRPDPEPWLDSSGLTPQRYAENRNPTWPTHWRPRGLCGIDGCVYLANHSGHDHSWNRPFSTQAPSDASKGDESHG